MQINIIFTFLGELSLFVIAGSGLVLACGLVLAGSIWC